MAGNAADDLAAPATEAPAGAELVVLTSFVLPYLSADERRRLLAQIEAIGRLRDVTWLALGGPVAGMGSLVPDLGDVTPALPDHGPDDAVLASWSMLGGRRSAAALAVVHPHGRYLRWL